MALRLILVGVVASLALDLPHGDVRPVATRAIRAVLVAEPARRAPDAVAAPILATEPALAQANLVIAADVTIKPAATAATIRPVVTIEPSLPVATPEIADAVPAPSPLPMELALAPIPVADSSPAPMPMPPVLDVASAPISPIADPVPAPVPTTVAVDPMAPPPSIAVEMSPEAAPAPAPAVADTEKPTPTDPEAGFRKVVSSMASNFAADLASATPPATEPQPVLARAELPPVAAPAPAIAAEEVVGEAVELDLYPGVAFALNREAEGIAPMVEPTSAPAPVAEPSRAERLSEAVKLTGQAMNAWAGLLSQRTPSSAVQR